MPVWHENTRFDRPVDIAEPIGIAEPLQRHFLPSTPLTTGNVGNQKFLFTSQVRTSKSNHYLRQIEKNSEPELIVSSLGRYFSYLGGCGEQILACITQQRIPVDVSYDALAYLTLGNAFLSLSLSLLFQFWSSWTLNGATLYKNCMLLQGPRWTSSTSLV